MKLKFIITLFLTTVLVQLFSQERKITLKIIEQPLTYVLDQIQNKSGYNILYSNDIADSILVTVNVSAQPVSEVLNSLLSPVNLFYVTKLNDMIIIGSNEQRSKNNNVFGILSKIKGIITDRNSAPVPYASVSLFNNDTLLTGKVSAENGVYELTYAYKPNTAYTIKASSIGFKTGVFDFIFPDTFPLRQLHLEEDKNALVDVTVSASKPLIERKVDRLIFNVENSIGALGGDAIDALRLTPTLQLKGEEIKIIGKSSVKLMVNEKIIPISGDALVTYLKSIPASTIQSIEVINTPPAKYDADGNSGLINIKLKEAKNDSWNTNVRGTYTQATYPSFNSGTNYSYKKNRFSLLADISYTKNRNIYTNDIMYIYPSETWYNNVINKNYRSTYGSLLNLQYALSQTKTIGLQYSGNFGKTGGDEINSSKSNSNGNLIKDYPTNGLSESSPCNISFNTNYTQKMDTLGKNFSIDLDYFAINTARDNNFSSQLNNLYKNTSQYLLAENSSLQNIQNRSVKIDFHMPYKWGILEYGGKLTTTQSKNYVKADFYDHPNTITPYLTQRDSFKYKENLQGLYISLNKKLNNKFDVKAGLRGEFTQTQSISITTDSIVSTNYFKLFPTAYLLYKPNALNTFAANFSRRISRPGFGYLNPARWYLNARSYAVGNPFLQPAFTYNYALSYNYRNRLNIETSLTDLKNGYSQFVYHDTVNDFQVFRRLNFYNIKSFSFTANLALRIFPWWETNTTANASYTISENFIPNIDRFYKGHQGGVATSNTLTLNKQKTLLSTIYFSYDLPAKENFYQTTSSSTLNIGFKYLAMNKRLILSLNFDDIFKTNYSTISYTAESIQQSFTQYYDARLVRFSLSYNFGNKNVSVRSRKVGNQEEKNRSN